MSNGKRLHDFMQEVNVRATYRYGFEWQELYCLDCKDKGKAWLEVPLDLGSNALLGQGRNFVT